MSNIYHTEPPTQGKVLLKTSYGDIDIELWPKEAPLACRNFIQLALEGYYDKSPITRVIKEFMVQFGDPTGTGTGGESIWGRPFKDEIHGRLLFNHRGQLAMANESTPNSNKSQFFVTLGACEWLNRKHTIFGKVTGDTIYNLLRLGESDVGENDRPVDPIQLLGVEVLWNPFEDIVPRVIVKEEAAIVPEKKKRKATKDLKLLSFGGEEEEGEEESAGISIPLKMKSAPEKTKKSKESSSGNDKNNKNDDRSDRNERNNVADKRAEEEEIRKLQAAAKAKASQYNFDDEDEEDDEEEGEGTAEEQKKRDIKQKGIEFQTLREGLLRSKRAVKVLTGMDAATIRDEIAFKDLISPLEQRRQKYIKKKTEFGSRQDETFAKLQNFTSAIRKNKKSGGNEDEMDGKSFSNKSSKGRDIDKLQQEGEGSDGGGGGGGRGGGKGGGGKGGEKEQFEAYNGQVLEGASDDEEVGRDWHTGKLKFRRHITDKLRKGESGLEVGGDGRRLDDYEVIDPRAKRKGDEEKIMIGIESRVVDRNEIEG